MDRSQDGNARRTGRGRCRLAGPWRQPPVASWRSGASCAPAGWRCSPTPPAAKPAGLTIGRGTLDQGEKQGVHSAGRKERSLRDCAADATGRWPALTYPWKFHCSRSKPVRSSLLAQLGTCNQLASSAHLAQLGIRLEEGAWGFLRTPLTLL
jgi:hypothetical protein